jgi:hypothetical protein
MMENLIETAARALAAVVQHDIQAAVRRAAHEYGKLLAARRPAPPRTDVEQNVEEFARRVTERAKQIMQHGTGHK